MIYLFVFLISIVSCYIGEKTGTSKKLLKYVFYGFAIIVLVIFAGCRDYTIGTDVRIYGNPLFYNAIRYQNLQDYLADNLMTVDAGYLVLNFIVSRFTASAHWLYAFIGLVIYLCSFIGIYRMRDRISVTFSWTFFILLFYAFSFNLMRQMMAMAIVFMGSIHLLNKNYIRFLPYVIIGMLFHQTSMIFSFAIIIMMIAMNAIDRKLFCFLIIAGAIALVFAYAPLLQFLLSHGILSEKYSRYILEASGTVSINPIIQRSVPIILFYIFGEKNWDEKDNFSNFFMAMMLMDLILASMRGIYASTMIRVSLYCSIFNIYGYSYFLRKITPKNNRIIIGVMLVVMFAGIWIYQIVYKGGQAIFPYTSEVLGIG